MSTFCTVRIEQLHYCRLRVVKFCRAIVPDGVSSLIPSSRHISRCVETAIEYRLASVSNPSRCGPFTAIVAAVSSSKEYKSVGIELVLHVGICQIINTENHSRSKKDNRKSQDGDREEKPGPANLHVRFCNLCLPSGVLTGAVTNVSGHHLGYAMHYRAWFGVEE